MEDASARFRITPWPSVVLPLPRSSRKLRFHQRDGLFFWDPDAPPTEEELDYHEIYLEIAALDLSSDDAITGFVERYEPLGMWHGQVNSEAGYLGLRLGVSRERVLASALRDREAGALHEEGHDIYAESIRDFRYGAASLQDLVAAWRWVNEGVQPDGWQCPAWAETPDIDGPPTTPLEAAHFISWGITEALERLYLPHILVTDEDREPDIAVISADLPLYCVCCLELFNHLIERLPYKQCANETCQRLFVRQRGRAKLGQHRATGVKYCSFACARAQAQREHRRRQRMGEEMGRKKSG